MHMYLSISLYDTCTHTHTYILTCYVSFPHIKEDNLYSMEFKVNAKFLASLD